MAAAILWPSVSLLHLTFKQANGVGGKVKKGGKALPICYWNFAFRDNKMGKVIPEDRIGLYDLKLVSKSGFLKKFKVFPTGTLCY